MGDKVAAIASDGFNYQNKGWDHDPYLASFVKGCSGRLSTFEDEINTNSPLLIRGVGGGARKAIQHCWKTGRTFYVIDTGYFGNAKHKIYHRITKNNLQYIGPIIDRPFDRLLKTNYRYYPFKPGKKILICPPSEKVMEIFGQPSPEQWTTNIINQLKEYTDRPIEVRLKPSRTERITNKTIEQALKDNVHCLITYNSIAAVEALMYGKPAIALGPNAAQVMCNTKISEVENLKTFKPDEMMRFMAHLSYCQFTEEEMSNGFAWRILNGGSS